MLKLPNDYDKVYIVCYPPGAGGNFLANCLSLDDCAVFSNARLVRLQLDGRFGIKDKLQYLHDKLIESAKIKKWNDLDLGNGQFFGVHSVEIQNQFPEILSFYINSIVGDTIDSGKRFFWTCHNILGIPTLKEKIWPGAKIIFFRDYLDFLRSRPGYNPYNANMLARPCYNPSDAKVHSLESYWQTVRDQSWPQYAPTDMAQFHQLPLRIQQELQGPFQFQIARWFDYSTETNTLWNQEIDILCQKYKRDSWIWSVADNYQTEEKLLSSLKSLCQNFDITLPPGNDVAKYFHAWRHTIAHL